MAAKPTTHSANPARGNSRHARSLWVVALLAVAGVAAAAVINGLPASTRAPERVAGVNMPPATKSSPAAALPRRRPASGGCC